MTGRAARANGRPAAHQPELTWRCTTMNGTGTHHRSFTTEDVVLVQRKLHNADCHTELPAHQCVMGCAARAAWILRTLDSHGRIAPPRQVSRPRRLVRRVLAALGGGR